MSGTEPSDLFLPSGALDDQVVLLLGSDTLLGRCLLERLVTTTRARQVLCLAATAPARGAQARLADELGAVGLERASDAAREVAPGAARVLALPGGYRQAHFGLDEPAFRELGQRVDLILSCAVSADAQACLSEQLRVHVGCVRDALRLAATREVPATLCHVSSCYAALEPDGSVEERIASDSYPARSELGVEFSALAEIDDLERLVAEVEQRANSQAVTAELAAGLRSQKRPSSAARLRSERERWLRQQLSALGEERARRWGWAGVHSFTRALGERLLPAAPATQRTVLVRHTLLGPALSQPEPGWLGGPDVLSPLLFLAEKGLGALPLEPAQTVDIVPVDQVAGLCLAVAAATHAGKASGVYHAGCGEGQAVRVARLVELTDLGLRGLKAPSSHASAPTVLEKLKALGGPRAVGKASAAARLPARLQSFFEGSARLVGQLPVAGLASVAERYGVASPAARGALAKAEHALEGVQQRVQSLCEEEAQLSKLIAGTFASYAPFVDGQRLMVRTRRARALVANLSATDRKVLQLDGSTFDWQRYWLDIALPGVRRYGFARLGAPSSALTVTDRGLSPLGLVSRVARRVPRVVAVEALASGASSRMTYAELLHAAQECCALLRSSGARSSRDVCLVGGDQLRWLVGLLAAFELDVAREEAVAAEEPAHGQRVVLVCDARPLVAPTGYGVSLRAQLGGAAPTLGVGAIPEQNELLRCSALHMPSAMADATRLAETLTLRERDRVVLVGKLGADSAFATSALHALSFGATLVLSDATGSATGRLPGARHVVMDDDSAAKLWRELEPHVNHVVGRNRQATSALLSLSRWCATELGVRAGRTLFSSVHQQLSDKLESFGYIGREQQRDVRTFDGLSALGLRILALESRPLPQETVELGVERPTRRAKRGSAAATASRSAKERGTVELRKTRTAAGARQ